MRWFAVHTNARSEAVAHRLLQQQGYESLYLHYRTMLAAAPKFEIEP